MQNTPTTQDRSKYALNDINNSNSGLVAKYSGTLGTAWFKARMSKSSSEEEKRNEEKRAGEYVKEIRRKKTDIINEYGLEIEKVSGNQVFFAKYEDGNKTKHTFTFVVQPKERAHLKEHTGLDIELFVKNAKEARA